MLRKIPWPWIGLYATLALFGAASYFKWYSMWGINHLAFLPSGWWVVYWLAVAAITALAVFREPTPRLDHIHKTVSTLIFGGANWPRVALVAGLAITFWILKTPTHFLGDGYTIRSNYGLPGAFVGSPTAPLASLAAQGMQHLLGLYDRFGVQLSFRILSIVSGIICVLNFIVVSRQLTQQPTCRLLSFMSFVVSGSLLLFFGYVEYYPLLWAGATTCMALSIRYIRTGCGFWLTLLSYPVVALLHIEGTILLPGLIAVLATRFPVIETMIRKRWILVASVFLTVVGFVVLSVVRGDDIGVARLTLPWFTAESVHGTVFSGLHLRDLVNIVLLILPGTIVLLLWSAEFLRHAVQDKLFPFGAIVAWSSLAFLAVANADLGSARDWDLLSLPVLSFTLLIMLIITKRQNPISGRAVVAYCLVLFLLTSAFLATSVSATPSEHRTESLLRLYGNRNRGGWLMLTKYFENKGDQRAVSKLRTEMSAIFPAMTPVDEGRSLLAVNRYNEAISKGREILRSDRFNADAWRLIGSSYVSQSRFDSAIVYLGTAARLSPYDPRLLNQLGQAFLKSGANREAIEVFKVAHRLDPGLDFISEGIALAHINLGEYEAATAIGDTLIEATHSKAGGTLVKLVIAVKLGDIATARGYYQEFIRLGADRSDYRAIIESYHDVLTPPDYPRNRR